VSLSNIVQDKAVVCIELRIGKLGQLADWKDAARYIITIYSRAYINVGHTGSYKCKAGTLYVPLFIACCLIS
jgi:hypothetical protein